MLPIQRSLTRIGCCWCKQQSWKLEALNSVLVRGMVRGFSSTSEARCRSKWVMPYFMELKRRNDEMLRRGHTVEKVRSTFIEWNLDAELYAFGARLQEEFDRKVLVTALMDRSYLARQQELLQVPSEGLESNEALASEGKALIMRHSADFVARVWPSIPLEAQQSLVDYLISEENLTDFGRSLGLRDLIFFEGGTADDAALGRAGCAVVGALQMSSPHRVAAFVEDYVTVRLADRRLRDVWQVSDPLALLQELLGRSDDVAEARLVASAGSGTLEAVYTVALYRRDRSYLAAGAGESVEVAVQEAAAVALDALFGDTASRPALPFRRAAPRVRHSLPAAPLPPTTAAAPLAPLSDWTLDRADARLANVVLCE